MKKVWILPALMLMLSGCPKSGSSGRNNTVYPGGTCVNCTYSQAAMGQSMTAMLPEGSMTLNLLAESNQLMMLSQYSNPLFRYQGQMSVTGNLNLYQEIYLGSCRLPMGNYTVQTLQAGVYDRGSFEIPAVQLIGPVNAVVAFKQAIIMTTLDGALYSFGATMMGISGPSVWNSGYPNMGAGYQMPGAGYGQSNCGDAVGIRF